MTSDVFVKRRAGAPPGFFESEAAGLRWLASTETVAIPRVVEVGRDHLITERVAAGHPTIAGAERLGQQLAALHGATTDRWGAPWPGFIGPLPMDNADAPDWPTFYAERRVRPFALQALDLGSLAPRDAEAVEAALDLLADLPGADEPPRRIHGDLWSGNVVWDPSGNAWLIDPAAHGGHRETDLAMLALFGAPHLGRLLGAYDSAHHLAEGWEHRQGLHQLHPLLVHAVLFGGAYGHRAGEVARQAIATWS